MTHKTCPWLLIFMSFVFIALIGEIKSNEIVKKQADFNGCPMKKCAKSKATLS